MLYTCLGIVAACAVAAGLIIAGTRDRRRDFIVQSLLILLSTSAGLLLGLRIDAQLASKSERETVTRLLEASRVELRQTEILARVVKEAVTKYKDDSTQFERVARRTLPTSLVLQTAVVQAPLYRHTTHAFQQTVHTKLSVLLVNIHGLNAGGTPDDLLHFSQKVAFLAYDMQLFIGVEISHLRGELPARLAERAIERLLEATPSDSGSLIRQIMEDERD